jgi:predicted phosphodiesterase
VKTPKTGNGIIAYGDPHANWKPLLRACEQHHPETVIIVGDCDLVDQTVTDALASLFRSGVAVRYVPGNHEADTEATWANLIDAHPDGNLHGKIAEIGCLRVAGLGGAIERKLWDPDSGRPPDFECRDAYINSLGSDPHREPKALVARASIFPQDLHEVASLGSADILVCHDAPTTHPKGFNGIDAVAELLGVRLVIHGHHHESYDRVLPVGAGIRVRGLGKAEPWLVDMARHRDRAIY